MSGIQPYLLEFHICRQARDTYQFEESIYTYSGNVVFGNIHAARVFAQKMNAKRDLILHPEQAVKASHVNAMALIDEILHLVLEEYRQRVNPQLMQNALTYLEAEIGRSEVDQAILLFSQNFPTLDVFRNRQALDDYLTGSSRRPDGKLVENRQIVLEEMLMLWLANMNPAFSPFSELFDDTFLKKFSHYSIVIDNLNTFLRGQPQFGPTGQSLIDILRSPALHAPDSLFAQLEFIRKSWSGFLGAILQRVLSSMDMVKEEEKPVFGLGGQGPSYVYDFTAIESEPELFSPDKDWMPNLVLIAKNSYVWLDQLSKKYERSITQLDQVPERELEELARWGITGLWLIGLWERSMASQRIKQLRGNPEAVASAYSLFSYDIAVDLGGEEAYQKLRDKAWKYGIRLASDMVPNHMGIDSRWVIEHPDWFISLDYSPFPNYSFHGPNLSWDTRVGIYLEDHYYNNQDAAVVFKRVDQWTGSEKYIYHGNDGTSMPWNDTAQLDYLLPEVREAVIQTILHVARKFPIIRFDAAMTLAKKHYHRLWYPEPGSGGDIPSRSEHGLTKAAFDEVFPLEFWREVVDRVAEEVPDTLLLAEAFWLMEGYFVRTLGMHRVYNSAFMNMLRDEKNQDYRLLIKNTLEFDPEILKRYVNFMNNPDERTAVDQFGKDDKYFGVSSMMATMPGLPMFGHGQVEGFTEKYGMEYRKAYWDESVDQDLVERHRRQVFPLLRKRFLFAQVENFALYDFNVNGDYVNEDVFAYSNRAGDAHTLFVYHNKYATTSGWIRNSCGYLVKTGPGSEDRQLTFRTLGESLSLHNEPGYYTIFRDHITNLEYLRSSQELSQSGLFIKLNAYECHVFMDFREVLETQHTSYGQLAAYLQGGGVSSVEEALIELQVKSIHDPFRELINPGMLTWLTEHRKPLKKDKRSLETFAGAVEELEDKIGFLLSAIADFYGYSPEQTYLMNSIRNRVLATLELTGIEQKKIWVESTEYKKALDYLQTGPLGSNLSAGDPQVWDVLLAWSFLSQLGAMTDPENYVEGSQTWVENWLLDKLIRDSFRQRNLSVEVSSRLAALCMILVKQSEWFEQCDQEDAAVKLLEVWLEDSEIQRYLIVHRYQDILWFNKEAFETFLWWLFVIATVGAIFQAGEPIQDGTPETVAGEDQAKQIRYAKIDLLACYRVIERLIMAMRNSNYQVERLLQEASAKQAD